MTALAAEWTKFRTVRGWVIAMVVAALLVAGFGIWASSGGQACGTMMPGGQIAAGNCSGPPLGPGGEAVTDSFYFVHQSLSGDGSITVRLTSLAGGNPSSSPDGPFTAGLQPWAKAGIIVAASLRPGSPYAAMLVTGAHGVRMQDDYTGDAAGLGGEVSAASPRWLRLVRSEKMLTGYDSADGAHWVRAGAVHLAGLPSTVLAGLFVTSPDAVTAESTSPTLATAVFDHVALSGPGGAWRGGPVGQAGAPSDAPGGRFGQADGVFTVSGAGDIAPAVANSGWSAKPADHALVGAFAGLIVVIVVGTMFMTAEYRRGLICTTLTASPRRSRVLAAKAIVAGAAAFATALPGAVVAVLLGPRLMRATGAYVFPVGVLTEVRVVAGTAAMFALVAVLALALGTILRHGAGPVTAVIAVVVMPYFFASPLALLPPGAADWLLRVTPAAGFAIQQVLPRYPQVANAYTPQYGYYPLPPWAGVAVLCAWTALALVAAGYLLRRRDA